ncbi:AIR synthase related protein [Schleiferia thermophila]|uniref:AIR synthase related protein n=1 Tax=Schleiferia thermophila TaxID=884107 RepID=UPI003EEA1F00
MFSKESSHYLRRGVSASKDDVHSAIKNLDKGLFPKAFCKIVPDYLSGDEEFCLAMHADGAGTKSSLAFAYWRETGDVNVWKGIAWDALVMNIDDLLCIGATGPFLVSSTIGRNKRLIPGEIISRIIKGNVEFCQMMSQFGIEVHLTGGETADVGDLVRTIIVDSTVITRLKKSQVIDNGNIKPGLSIVGLSSFGQSTYEENYNSGIGSNGLTAARHDLFHSYLKDIYPQTYDPDLEPNLIYTGPYRLTDKLEGTPLDFGSAVLSPTRTYAPVIKAVLEACKSHIYGMVHCSGGGQTKILNFIENAHVIKDNLFDTPPLFKAIQKVAGLSWREMYTIYNMGHRMEIYCDPQVADLIVKISEEFNIEAKIIGRVEPSANGKKLTLITPTETLQYR